MKPAQYQKLKEAVIDAGFGHEIDWAETVKAPNSANDFALEAAYIICNSGMRWTVARKIYDGIVPHLMAGRSSSCAFGHQGKTGAIDHIWNERADLFAQYSKLPDDDQRLQFLGDLPWIGDITKYHLAKNFGVDCAKPDRWLERIADHFKTSPQQLCKALSESSGDRVATVDLVLWRAAERNLIWTD